MRGEQKHDGFSVARQTRTRRGLSVRSISVALTSSIEHHHYTRGDTFLPTLYRSIFFNYLQRSMYRPWVVVVAVSVDLIDVVQQLLRS
jgi:hypothetical protein